MGKKKQLIFDLTTDELIAWCHQHNIKPFRAKQIIEWLYVNRVTGFDGMTNLSLSLREKLSKQFHFMGATIEKAVESDDGTTKFQLKLSDDHSVEAVYLPRKDGYTLCISSQVGCALGCRFCATGSMGIIRNLSRGEILSQILIIQDRLSLNPHGNIVFMGMGEPLLNTEAVLSAIDTLVNPDEMGWSPRRITLSTAGIIPEIRRLASISPGVNLAISLNGADDKVRSRLMPINKKYPLNDLITTLKDYPLPSNQQKITFEYVMIRNINDSLEQARKLTRLLDPKRDKINLIPLNPVDNSRFKASAPETILQFQALLKKSGFSVFIRHSQGDQIDAACGQLISRSFQEAKPNSTTS